VPLRGNLSTMSVPEVLQFLGSARRTGVLHVDAGTQRKDVLVEDGAIVFCSAGAAKEMLGHHLLAHTSLSELDLHEAFAEQDASGRRLGEILVSAGKIAAEELDRLLHSKLEDSLYDVFTWRAGMFDYEERGLRASDAPVRLDLGWFDALKEGARRADALARIRQVVPGRSARFEMISSRFPRSMGRDRVDLDLLDLAREGLSAGEACERLHASDFVVLTRLEAMIHAGVLRVAHVGKTRSPVDPDATLHAGGELAARGRLSDAREVLRAGCASNPEYRLLSEALQDVEGRLWTSVRSALGDLKSAPELTVSMERIGGPGLTPKEAFVASRLNGRWSAESIARVCPFDELDVHVILENLFRRGFIAMRIGVEAPENEPATKRTGELPAATGGVPTPRPRKRREGLLALLEPGPGSR
jgi:hypothetical protein